MSRLLRARNPSPTPPRHDDPDVVLMLRVQRDEPGAFAELVDRFWPKVFGRCKRLLVNRQDAEDLAQEVFLRLYRARKRYRPCALFNTWLYHITHNAVRNALRVKRRLQFTGVQTLAAPEDSLSTQAPHGDVGETPARSLERRELASVVRAAVGDLGERQRQALEMHQFQCRSCAEIAAELEMTAKAAKSLLYRARLNLRTLLLHFVQGD